MSVWELWTGWHGETQEKDVSKKGHEKKKRNIWVGGEMMGSFILPYLLQDSLYVKKNGEGRIINYKL